MATRAAIRLTGFPQSDWSILIEAILAYFLPVNDLELGEVGSPIISHVDHYVSLSGERTVHGVARAGRGSAERSIYV